LKEATTKFWRESRKIIKSLLPRRTQSNVLIAQGSLSCD
jgi:hypothetical protein